MNRRQFLQRSALAAGALLVPWPALTDREPFYATLHSSHDGEIARVPLMNVMRWDDGHWDAADCTFVCVMGYSFHQVRVLDEGGVVLGVMEVGLWTPMGADVDVMWEATGLPQ